MHPLYFITLASYCLCIAFAKLQPVQKLSPLSVALISQINQKINSNLPVDDDFRDLFEDHSPTKKFYNIFSKIDDKGERVLTYYGLMLAGAIARSAAATAVHPLNVIKTMLQCKDSKMPELKWSVLSRGAGAQFLMSIPHGAFNFAVTEVTFAPYGQYNPH